MRPLFLTTDDLQTFYKLSQEQALRLTEVLDPCGEAYTRGNYLYARPDVEKAIKKGLHRA